MISACCMVAGTYSWRHERPIWTGSGHAVQPTATTGYAASFRPLPRVSRKVSVEWHSDIRCRLRNHLATLRLLAPVRLDRFGERLGVGSNAHTRLLD